MGFQWKQSF